MKIIELEIRNIRGIKEVILKPDQKNFVIWGKNGTGKSGVVDSIDFLLTGKISRLIGTGTGGITLEAHGSHIDCDDLSQAYVRAIVQLNENNSQVEITRCMDDPYTLHGPEDLQEQLSTIEKIAGRGQHVLTRRDILRFITSTAGNRAKDIQELMNLTEIENARSNFKTVKNETRKDKAAAEKSVRSWETKVAVRVGLEEFDKQRVLTKINELRVILNGEEISEVSDEILKADLNPPTFQETTSGGNITTFESQLNQLLTIISTENQNGFFSNDQQLRNLVSGIHEDAELMQAYTGRELVNSGIKLIDDTGKCPLCDTPWEPGELELYLKKKLDNASQIEQRVNQINETARILEKVTLRVKALLENVLPLIKNLALNDDAISITKWISDLEILEQLLADPLGKYHHIDFSTDQVKRILAPENIDEIITRAFGKAKEQFLDSTPEQVAWDTLTELSVELQQLQEKINNHEKARIVAERALILHQEFVAARDEILNDLYDGIRSRFVELYRELHREDEVEFEAILQLSEASLDFEVDFFGRGTHPPHALHSEGHQDSMGICLFLALSEKLTRGEIDLIVLDDVVMSVDKGHRRQLCKVLADNFPDNQFLITTHDQTWALELKSNAVVESKNMFQFFDWEIDSGPRISDTKNLWDRIDRDMEFDDIPAAAAKLRRGSEQFLAEACDQLAAPVPFSMNGRYEFGDLLLSATKRFKELLVEATQATASWNEGNAKDIEVLSSERKKTYKDLNMEQWAVNVNVHYNDWAGFGKEDFQPVVDAFKALFSLFTCPECGGMISLVREGKANKNVKCPCNNVNWNLEKK